MRSLIKALSLGAMLLGIGFISWTMLSVRVPVSYSASEMPGSNSDSTVSDIERNRPSAEVNNLYPDYPAQGDYIGTLTIPALKRELPVFEGTGAEELKKGVGHYLRSMLPGEKDNSVLSGHRETVFRGLGDLKQGDLLIVDTSAGRFTYEIAATRIVDKDDKTVIVPTDQAVLTLTTCYPFVYVGNAPDRYIVSAVLIGSILSR